MTIFRQRINDRIAVMKRWEEENTIASWLREMGIDPHAPDQDEEEDDNMPSRVKSDFDEQWEIAQEDSEEI